MKYELIFENFGWEFLEDVDDEYSQRYKITKDGIQFRKYHCFSLFNRDLLDIIQTSYTLDSCYDSSNNIQKSEFDAFDNRWKKGTD